MNTLFSVHINEDDIFPVVHLKQESEKTEVIIYSLGALLNTFIVQGKPNLVDGFDSCKNAKENITNGFKSCKLSPFVCRITEGKYVFNQHEYKTGKFFLDEEAIHGLLYDAPFVITDSGADNASASVTLQYTYTKKNEGFPFEYTCAVTYRLEKQNKLSIITLITNNSEDEMPLCDGWHPYFTLGETINNLSFELNADTMLEFNEHLVPTGKIVPFNKFQIREQFGNTFLDNCFLLSNYEKPACVLEDAANGLRLSIWPDQSYPYLQIYTPDHRKSIAVENLSAAPDAFNNGRGIKILKPAESYQFKTTFHAEIF